MDNIASRKDAHLDICLERSVEAAGVATGLGGYCLEHVALPEIDFKDVDLATTILGKPLQAPLIIGSMTGGTERAGQINARLARAASQVGVAMALGSQRAMIANPELSPTYTVRRVAPQLPLLFGNVGAVQLNLGMSAAQISEALAAVQADAVFLHLNPLQEAIQPEGDTQFAGLFERLSQVIPKLPVPCLVKEVSAGISARAARLLAKLPLAGVETAGVGGTCWAKVESYRATGGSAQAQAGRRLSGFGIPTAASVEICRQVMPDKLVIASGGIRTGMDVAVALALGADAVALARPLLRAAIESEQAVVSELETLCFELRVICFCTGVKTVAQLRRSQVLGPRELTPPHRPT